MRPEPAHRTTRRKRAPNERPGVSIRTGSIRDELDARSDGTEPGYRAVIMRDLQRYWAWLTEEYENRDPGEFQDADYWRALYDRVGPDDGPHVGYWTVDALERAHILVEHAGLTVDAALVSVGLVKEKQG